MPGPPHESAYPSGPASASDGLPSQRNSAGLIDDLRHAQEQHGYISAGEIQEIARRRSLHIKDVHAVASYFPHFRLKPPARVDIRICDDMSCHLHGASQLRKMLELRFAGQRDVVIRDVSCLGRCDRPCVVRVNDYVLQGAALETTTALIRDELQTTGTKHEPSLPRGFAERGLRLKSDPYPDQTSRYTALRKLVETRDGPGVLSALRQADLRGMGGAGFPVYRKWEAVREAPGPEKFVICNADESEPGTIKDRFLLQHLPYLVLEGMIVCGLVTGAGRGYLYCRHEYEQQIEVLRTELARLYSLGLCGRDILGSGQSFELEVLVSPGGYICGEETALMEVIEGRRGEPRNKPPRTVVSGLWSKPTALNNVETFALASSLLVQGAPWYKAQGRPGYSGLKFVGVTGSVVNPGVFEVPMGVSYRELIYDYAGGPPPGEDVIGFAPSGPSSGYLPASMLDVPLDWESLRKLGSMVGSAAVVVCTGRACMLDMAFNAVRFYRNESCGKCAPCRLGTQKMVEMLDGWIHGTTLAGDLHLLGELSHTLKQTSLCGLGQIAPVPIQSVIEHFPDEVRGHIDRQECRAGICFPLRGARP